MNTREWALLIFTILGQLSVGMMLVLMIVRTFAFNTLSTKQASNLTNKPMYMVVPVMILAMVASLFHLGKVLHVIGAVPNLATSWMSREVVFGVAFMALLVVYAFLVWREIGSESLRTVIGWITAIVGLIYIFCMGMTYMLPAEPAWNTAATPINFFVTTLLLGVLGGASALMINHAAMENDSTTQEFVGRVLRWNAMAGIILLGLELIVLPLYMAFLGTQGTAAIHSLGLMFGSYGAAMVIRLALVVIGAGIIGASLYRNASETKQENTWATLAYSAFVLVLVSEVIGRFIFYAVRFRIGI